MNRYRSIILVAPALLLAFAAIPATVWAKGVLPDGFYGTFRGAVTAPGNSGGEFNARIEGRGEEFTVHWQPRISVSFEPAGRPGVFRDSKSANPMAGDTVYWARLVEARLIVYSMVMDEHGGYDIASYIYTLDGKDLNLVVRRVRAGGDAVELSGKLERNGG